MPIIRHLRHNRVKKESVYLLDYAKSVTSQYGEDGILEKIFELIGEGSKWCVEFGAWDGYTHSNTYNLIANKGWSSIQIEGNARRHEELVKRHGDNPKVHCVGGMVGLDPRKDSLEFHFGKTPMPQSFDLLSIDIDGNDWHIWKSVTKYRPRVVMIEFNPAASNEVVYVQDLDFEINQGSTLRAMVELGKQKKYELVCVTSSNAIFVVEEEFAKIGIADNSIDSMFYPSRSGSIFMLYDGTMVNVGLPEVALRQLDNKRRKIDPFQFQVYSADERGYGGRVPTELLTAERPATKEAVSND